MEKKKIWVLFYFLTLKCLMVIPTTLHSKTPELFMSTHTTQAGKHFISASLPLKHISARLFLDWIPIWILIHKWGDLGWGGTVCQPTKVAETRHMTNGHYIPRSHPNYSKTRNEIKFQAHYHIGRLEYQYSSHPWRVSEMSKVCLINCIEPPLPERQFCWNLGDYDKLYLPAIRDKEGLWAVMLWSAVKEKKNKMQTENAKRMKKQ